MPHMRAHMYVYMCVCTFEGTQEHEAVHGSTRKMLQEGKPAIENLDATFSHGFSSLAYDKTTDRALPWTLSMYVHVYCTPLHQKLLRCSSQHLTAPAVHPWPNHSMGACA